MKKLFVCAAAAIVALASCSKTEYINNQEPKGIAFKAVTGSITKAEATALSATHSTMGVFAFVHNTENTPYFTNGKFEPNTGTNTWEGGYFWPLQSSLDFMVYAPYGDDEDNLEPTPTLGNSVTPTLKVPVKTIYNVNNNAYSVSTTGSQDATHSNQTDYLYGKSYFNDGYTYNSASIPIELKHALSKITFNIDCSNIEIHSVKLSDFHTADYYTVTYGQETSVVWNSTASGKNLLVTDLDHENTSATFLIVPSVQYDILINYTLDGAETDLDAKIVLSANNDKWLTGYHYTYNIKIDPKGIQLVPLVSPWTPVTDSPNGTPVPQI